jgi:predicted dehydrogenase
VERVWKLNADWKNSETRFPQIDHFGAQIAYFSDCIAAGTPPEADGEEGLADMRALLAIEKACLTGRAQPITAPARPRHPTADMVRLAAPTDRRLVF